METLKLPSQNSTQDPAQAEKGTSWGLGAEEEIPGNSAKAGPYLWVSNSRPPPPSQLREGSCLECLWQSSQARGGLIIALHPGMSAERAPFFRGWVGRVTGLRSTKPRVHKEVASLPPLAAAVPGDSLGYPHLPEIRCEDKRLKDDQGGLSTAEAQDGSSLGLPAPESMSKPNTEPARRKRNLPFI